MSGNVSGCASQMVLEIHAHYFSNFLTLNHTFSVSCSVYSFMEKAPESVTLTQLVTWIQYFPTKARKQLWMLDRVYHVHYVLYRKSTYVQILLHNKAYRNEMWVKVCKRYMSTHTLTTNMSYLWLLVNDSGSFHGNWKSWTPYQEYSPPTAVADNPWNHLR